MTIGELASAVQPDMNDTIAKTQMRTMRFFLDHEVGKRSGSDCNWKVLDTADSHVRNLIFDYHFGHPVHIDDDTLDSRAWLSEACEFLYAFLNGSVLKKYGVLENPA
jgi:hypothetical protein